MPGGPDIGGDFLLWGLLALQVVILVLLTGGWWWLRRETSRDDEAVEQDILRKLRHLEESAETRLDLVLSQVLQLSEAAERRQPALEEGDDEHRRQREARSANLPILEEQPFDESESPEEERAEAPDEASDDTNGETPFPEGVPTFIDPRSFKAEVPRNRLQSLLNDSEFLDAVWHRMDGPFDQAVRHVADYLVGKGIPEPKIVSHPQIARSEANHWRFMVVSSKEPGSDGNRVLIPRHYDRYDPALHLHLFRLQGDPAAEERHLRELRRCALLSVQGDLSETVQPKFVLEKGVMVV